MRIIAVLTLLAAMMSVSLRGAAQESVGITFMLDELEYLIDNGADTTAWSAGLVFDNGERQFWLVSEGEHNRGSLEGHEVHAYISQPLGQSAALIAGWRGDLKPEPERDWAMLGIENSWVFDIETSLAAYFGSAGDTALRFKVERDWSLAPGWTLVPELETNAFGHTDLDAGVGSAFADIEIAARIFYTLSQVAKAYVGAVWSRPLGNTRDIARAEGDGSSESMIVLGFAVEF